MTTPATDEQIIDERMRECAVGILLLEGKPGYEIACALARYLLRCLARIEEDRREIERLRQLRASIDEAFAGHKGCAPYDLDCGVGADIALILKDYDDEAGREKR